MAMAFELVFLAPQFLALTRMAVRITAICRSSLSLVLMLLLPSSIQHGSTASA
jgi:hypothetical protein